MNRDEFLERVSAGGRPETITDPGDSVARPIRNSAGNLISRFTSNLTALGGTVHQPDGSAEAIETIAALMLGSEDRPFLAWDSQHLPLPGVLDELAARGLHSRPHDVPAGAKDRHRHQLGYYDCVFGLTGATAGLAETGSVVVDSGRGRPRMASLIPQVHVALLDRKLLWPSLGEWIDAHPDELGSAANWTVITGPSRTADIEQVLTRGVHGPREVHVVLF